MSARNMSRDGLRLTTIEAHTAGEPLRLITGGLPPLSGRTILEKRRHFREAYDDLRTALMWEPRGHADMYGCVLTEPERPDSHCGVLFLHNEGYSTMCGHGIIALTKVALEEGLVGLPAGAPELRIDTPAGLVVATAQWDGRRVVEVAFTNVPSFVLVLDREVDVPGLGRLRVDVAFGGAFYAFCRAEGLGLRLVPEEFRLLIDVGMRIKRAVMAALDIRHPLEPDLGFLYGTIIVGPAHDPRNGSRNVCVFAAGEVDRSPTGTGVSARAALHYARGEIKLGEPFVVESLLGTTFRGRALREAVCGPYPAVVPEVTGSAFITGRSEFELDPEDPLKYGFILR
ncbi:MAG: proline racemase family protein [Candidatus Aminicenantes bacterium]|nr:proline racemase family protein [Candidatus Aminicenantes bacterium]